ncbi:NYN domain-containing protein [Methylobacterium sp. Leaf108]|uniref:NYN domain-containing protein n=1 Tax=Methylobacterium sp. Leaf108 TaxID=1736256 RepID=UPI0012E70DC1|nr:NYN domain-containing protein [Methylobacterium sp. Leaf108]
MSRHIIIDNSNIYSTMTGAAARIEPQVPWVGIRMHLDNFFDALENRSETPTRVFVGSEKSAAASIWQKAKDRGYETYILKRIIDSDDTTSEQAVDEIAHLKIANAVLDYDGEQTLVIVSGDGKISDFGTSFPQQAERALKRGWSVEVWAFSDGMTSAYKHLMDAYPGRLRKVYLDDFYDNITFVQTHNLRNPTASLPVHLKRNAKSLIWPWL